MTPTLFDVLMKSFASSIAVFLTLAASSFAQGNAVSANYRLTPNDQITMSVFGEPDITDVAATVAGSGMVNLPLIKPIRLAGKTVREAELAVTQAYIAQELFRSPQVTISVKEFAQHSVTILGQVGKPGVVPIPGGQARIDLVTAIASAGDFRGIANQKKVRITRNRGKANEKTEEVNVKDIMNGRARTKTVYLFPGDVVFVPQRII